MNTEIYKFYREVAAKTDTLVDVRNVAKWVFSDPEFRDKKVRDRFPVMRLPWKTAYLEYDMPRTIAWESSFTIKTQFPVSSIGALVRETDEAPHEGADFERIDKDVFVSAGLYLEIAVMLHTAHGPMMLFVEHVPITNRGTASPQVLTQFFEPFMVKDAAHPDIESIKAVAYALSAPVMFSVCLLNCQNIELVNRKVSRQYRRQMERNGKPIIKFKTLNVEPLKSRVRQETPAGESQIKRALHICRGHFAHYGPERKLFGKYEGAFWRPMHVRGSKKHGEIVKDYRVLVDE